MSLTKNIKALYESATARVIEWANNTSIWGYKGVSLYEVFYNFKRQLKDDNIIERAAAISFNFAMAMPPMIMFLFTLIPFLPINKAFIQELYDVIRDIIPGQNYFGEVKSFLEDFLNKPRNGLLSLGFLASIFFSSNAMMGIMRSFDKNLPGFVKRKGLHKRWAALKMTIVLIVFFFIGLALLAAQGAVLEWLGIKNVYLRQIIGFVRWGLIIALFFFIISYLYRYAPSRDKRWKLFTPGSIVATFIMLVFALVFSWWVSNFGNYNKLYGSIGTLLVLLISINLNALALLVGFEINISMFAVQRQRNAEKEEALADDVLL